MPLGGDRDPWWSHLVDLGGGLVGLYVVIAISQMPVWASIGAGLALVGLFFARRWLQ